MVIDWDARDEPRFDLSPCGCHRLCLVCGWLVLIRSSHDPEVCESNLDYDQEDEWGGW